MASMTGRKLLHSKVEEIRRIYRSGHWPLLLYHGHVVAVHSVMKYANKMVFGIYDANYSNSTEYVIA